MKRLSTPTPRPTTRPFVAALFVLSALLSGAAQAATHEIDLGTLSITTSFGDTMLTLTIPEGNWTNFTAMVDWSSTDPGARSFLASWELEPINAPSDWARHTSTYMNHPEGAFGDNRNASLSWGGVLQNPIISDGTTQVAFTAAQLRDWYTTTAGRTNGPATWTDFKIVLHDTPIHQTHFAGEINEDTDDLMLATRPRSFWEDNVYTDPEDPETWRLYGAFLPRERPHDLIPFHVTADGYYRIDVFNEVGTDSDMFWGQLSLHEGGFNPNDTDGIPDFVLTMDTGEDSDRNSVEAFLQAGVQYYAAYSASWYPANRMTGLYEGSILGVNGEAIIGLVPTHPPGDFDMDGDVDGHDFLLWQRGGSPNSLSAADLADWQANFGMSTPSTGEALSVPEPSALLSVVVALIMAIPRRAVRHHVHGVLRRRQ